MFILRVKNYGMTKRAREIGFGFLFIRLKPDSIERRKMFRPYTNI
jgi:hypothetical protein